MVGIEFYNFESELWYRTSDGRNELFDETKTELIRSLLGKIRECYTDAYNALASYYESSAGNPVYYQYLIVRRFLNCNFSLLDPTKVDIDDIGEDGRFNFEKVPCPVRCECKMCGVVCTPKFNTSLSKSEERVARMWSDGKSKDEIAGSLFISPETVNNHIRSVYAKIGVHEKAEFVKYVLEHDLFKSL